MLAMGLLAVGQLVLMIVGITNCSSDNPEDAHDSVIPIFCNKDIPDALFYVHATLIIAVMVNKFQLRILRSTLITLSKF